MVRLGEPSAARGQQRRRAGTATSVTYVLQRQPVQNSCFEPLLLTTHVVENRVMIGIVIIGVVTALAVFAILAKTCAGGPKKAEKWEKGEIIEQLLALSGGENSSSAIASIPARSRSASTSATRSDTLRKGTSRKRDSKRRYSPIRSNPPISLRPNRPDADIEEKTRQRAYELYQERGGVDGNPTDDWLQAKQEVLSQKARAGTPSS